MLNMVDAILIYIIYLLFLVSLCFCKKSKLIPFICVITFILLFVCSEIGADYNNYSYIYYQSGKKNFEIGHVEKFYLYINYISNCLGISYKIFRIILLSSCLTSISIILYKTSSNFAFSFLILYSLYIIYMVSAYRQLITMTIFLISIWLYFYKKRYSSVLILNFIAIFIHKLAIVQLFLFVILMLYDLLGKKKSKLNYKLKNIILLILACLVIRVILVFVLNSGYISVAVNFIPSEYLKDVSFINKGLLSRLLFFIITLFIYNYSERDEIQDKLLFIYIISMTLYFMVPYELIMGRIINNFRMLEAIIIPNAFIKPAHTNIYEKSYINGKVRILLLLLLMCLMIVIFVNQIMNQSGYFPIFNYFIGEI